MKIGVLGLGSIGQRHANNAVALGHEVFYHDPSLNGHQPNIWDTPRDVILDKDNSVEAIIVASPSKQHAHDFIDAVDAGKHVLVEKPFGYDCPPYLDGYLQGARSRYNKNLIIATGFNCRFHNCVRFTRSVMDTLGEIQAASFSVLQKSEKPEYLRDGVIRNWLSHEIDLAHHLFGFGDVEFCSADDQREANIIMKFPSVRDHVFINGDYFTEPQQRYFWIDGSKASLYVNLERREVYRRLAGESPILLYQAKDTWDETYIEEMKCFIRSIELGVHLEPLATGEDGIKALYTVMAAREKAGI